MDDNKCKSPIISLEKLLQKEHEFVSLKDAFQDVVPQSGAKMFWMEN